MKVLKPYSWGGRCTNDDEPRRHVIEKEAAQKWAFSLIWKLRFGYKGKLAVVTHEFTPHPQNLWVAPVLWFPARDSLAADDGYARECGPGHTDSSLS